LSDIGDIRNSYGKYYLALNAGYKYFEYQQRRIVPKLEALERGEILRLAIFMSPGDSKSDLTTRNFVPYYLGKHPDHNAMVCSYSAELASDDFGAKIKRRMEESALHLKIFPDSALTQDSRSKKHFATIKDGHFYAVGFDGGITGRRIDLFGLDDLVKNWEEAESEATQVKLFETYMGVVKDRLKPNAKIFLCAHRWTMNDVYKRIIDAEGTVENGGDWTVLTLPAEDPPGCGTFLWEDYHGKKHYEDFKKKNDKIWWGKFQQNPSASEEFWFKEQWLNFYDIAPKVGKFKAYLFCDPGASKDRKSDRTSIQVFCAGQDKKLFLVDWVLDKMHPGERQKVLERLIRRWSPEINIYEEYGMVTDTWYFNEAAEKNGFDAVLTPVGRKGPRHNLSKATRIDGLKPWFEEGRIFLPRKFNYTMTNGQTVDLVQRFIKEEYLVYKGTGSVSHEDDLDAMSRVNEPEVIFDWWVPENERPERKPTMVGSSWESLY
jgi:hypothetical protein